MKVFLSYASERETVAEQIYLALANSGHDVFFDRTSCVPGCDYNSAILAHLRASELMIYLISPESVEDGAYARTELRFARDIWPDPAGHVLPVMAAPTPLETIPNYLRAITILSPEGNVAAEVSAAVHDLSVGHDPAETVAGQKAILDETRRNLQEIAVKQELEALDREWQKIRSTHLVKVNDRFIEPTSPIAREVFDDFGSGVVRVLMILSALAFVGGMTLTGSLLFASLLVIIAFVFAIPFAGLSVINGLRMRSQLKQRAIEYERAESEYSQRRNRLIANAEGRSGREEVEQQLNEPRRSGD